MSVLLCQSVAIALVRITKWTTHHSQNLHPPVEHVAGAECEMYELANEGAPWKLSHNQVLANSRIHSCIDALFLRK
jgi:hypothetical protein